MKTKRKCMKTIRKSMNISTPKCRITLWIRKVQTLQPQVWMPISLTQISISILTISDIQVKWIEELLKIKIWWRTDMMICQSCFIIMGFLLFKIKNSGKENSITLLYMIIWTIILIITIQIGYNTENFIHSRLCYIPMKMIIISIQEMMLLLPCRWIKLNLTTFTSLEKVICEKGRIN
jgi:hypothetical protein